MKKTVFSLILFACTLIAIAAPCFANAPPVRCESGDFVYYAFSSSATIIEYNGTGDTIEIPDTIDDLMITQISKDAIGSRPDVTTLILPTTVSGASGAFAGLTNVQTIELVGPSTGLNVENGVLTLTTYKGGKEILIYPASKTDELYELPEKTYEVTGAFAYNENLRVLVLPSDLWRIEPGDLDGLINLKKVQIRKSTEPGAGEHLRVDENGALWRKLGENEELIWEPRTSGAVPGDVNCDGRFNSRDIVDLMKFLVGFNEELDFNLADHNGDGRINSRDVVAMMKDALAAEGE